MGFGITELIIILVLVLVLFGAGKLPGVMGEFGKGLSMFKKGVSGEDLKQDGPQELEPKKNSSKKTTKKSETTNKS